jgi:hypothetical protein
MSGEEGEKPSVLVDPCLRALVVKAVNIVDVDWDVGIGRMSAGGRGEEVADKN